MSIALKLIAELKQTANSAKSKPTPDFFEFEDGTMIWNASLVLLHYLCEHKDCLKGKRVLELGSGLGHLAVGLARVGANVTCTERPKCMAELEASISSQLGQGWKSEQSGVSIEAVELEWGEAAFCNSPLSKDDRPPFDVIILAELVYNTSFHEKLLWTIKRFSHPRIAIYSCILDRPFSFMFFADIASDGTFEVKQITGFDALGVDEELLCLHELIPLDNSGSSCIV